MDKLTLENKQKTYTVWTSDRIAIITILSIIFFKSPNMGMVGSLIGRTESLIIMYVVGPIISLVFTWITAYIGYKIGLFLFRTFKIKKKIHLIMTSIIIAITIWIGSVMLAVSFGTFVVIGGMGTIVMAYIIYKTQQIEWLKLNAVKEAELPNQQNENTI